MDNRRYIMLNGKRKKTRLYNIWSLMRHRCRNKDDPSYGGRGISVCSTWNNFETFWKWAKSNGYRGNLSIDRVKNDQGYNPGNCRWADKWTQNQNRDIVNLITFKGEEKTIGAWAKIIGLSYKGLYRRLLISEWGVEYSLTAPRYSPAPPWAKKSRTA